MAVEQVAPNGHPDMDYPEHDKTYAMFLWLLKWGAIAAAAILVLLAFLTL